MAADDEFETLYLIPPPAPAVLEDDSGAALGTTAPLRPLPPLPPLPLTPPPSPRAGWWARCGAWWRVWRRRVARVFGGTHTSAGAAHAGVGMASFAGRDGGGGEDAAAGAAAGAGGAGAGAEQWMVAREPVTLYCPSAALFVLILAGIVMFCADQEGMLGGGGNAPSRAYGFWVTWPEHAIFAGVFALVMFVQWRFTQEKPEVDRGGRASLATPAELREERARNLYALMPILPMWASVFGVTLKKTYWQHTAPSWVVVTVFFWGPMLWHALGGAMARNWLWQQSQPPSDIDNLLSRDHVYAILRVTHKSFVLCGAAAAQVIVGALYLDADLFVAAGPRTWTQVVHAFLLFAPAYVLWFVLCAYQQLYIDPPSAGGDDDSVALLRAPPRLDGGDAAGPSAGGEEGEGEGEGEEEEEEEDDDDDDWARTDSPARAEGEKVHNIANNAIMLSHLVFISLLMTSIKLASDTENYFSWFLIWAPAMGWCGAYIYIGVARENYIFFDERLITTARMLESGRLEAPDAA